MHWQKIIETYHSLPEGERTTLRIASKLRAEGHRFYNHQIGHILKYTVLGDCIDSRDLLATAKVLQTLVDFTITEERSDKFPEVISEIIKDVMDGVSWHGGGDYVSTNQISRALSHIVNLFYQAQLQAAEYEAYKSRYETDAPWGRYIVRHTEDDDSV